MDKKTLALIEAACKELGISRVEFLRMAAEEKLAADKKSIKGNWYEQNETNQQRSPWGETHPDS